MRSSSKAYQAINTMIERFEQDEKLFIEEEFIARMEAVDELEFHVLEEVEQLNDALTESEKSSFIQRCNDLKGKLDTLNDQLLVRLLTYIRANDRDAINQYFRQAAAKIERTTNDDIGYDELDLLLNALFEVDWVPEESRKRDTEMMFYQPTPVRIILRLIDSLGMNDSDVFYDLGSGLGHVPILITLLTGVKTKGVERDDEYIRYSETRLNKLKVEGVTFICDDVRNVDYLDGTVFYLYTPFRGELLQEVMSKLEAVSKLRPIRVCAFGPCTLAISKQSWLESIVQSGSHEDHFGIFVSR